MKAVEYKVNDADNGLSLTNRGERHGLNKLSQAEAMEIKYMHNKSSYGYLAKQYGVGVSTIRDIRRGKSWAWL